MIGLYVSSAAIGQTNDHEVEDLTRLVGDHPHRLYVDRGVSGKVEFAGRPQGRRLLGDVEDGLISEVWFREVCRCGGNARDIVNTLHEFRDHGVQVRVVHEGLALVDEPSGRLDPAFALVLSVLSSLAELEDGEGEEVREGGVESVMLHYRRAGRRPGSAESNVKFLSKPKNRKILSLLQKGHNVSHVSSIVGCSRPLVRKVRDVFLAEQSGLSAWVSEGAAVYASVAGADRIMSHDVGEERERTSA